MKNLATSYPHNEMYSNQFVFIPKDDPLFKKHNYRFPPPEVIIVKREQLEVKYPNDIRRLELLKPAIVYEIENRINLMDKEIFSELVEARINVMPMIGRVGGEVPTRYTGLFRGWKFERAWCYWVATSQNDQPIDPELAKKIYDSELGSQSIRTDGHAGNLDSIGRRVLTYHIDCQAGLNLFIKFLKGEVE